MPDRALLLPVTLVLLLLACTPSHSSPLHDAAVNQDIVLLQQLLDSRKHDVNGLDINGRTPLAAALATCSSGMGRSPGMAPHAQPHAAQIFATGSSGGISAALIYAGADVNVDVFPKEHPGYKLVHHAACSSPGDLAYLLAGGADANAPYRLPDGRTVTPLTWAALCAAAATCNSTTGWDNRYPGFSIRLLLDAGADPLPFGPANPPSALLYPKPHPLSHCNKPGACSDAEVDRMYDASWDGGAKFPDDFSYFHWWTLWGGQEAKAAGPAVKPELASWHQHHGPYDRELVEAALAIARAWAKKAAERYARAYPLHGAVAANNLTAVTALLASGKFDVNGRDYRGLTPLQASMACEKSDVDCWTPVEPVEIAVAEYLVSKGADVRLDVYPGSGYTLLHKAAFRGLTRLVKALLKGGADPNAVYFAEDDKQRKDPQTPLTRAASHCSVDEAVRDSFVYITA